VPNRLQYGSLFRRRVEAVLKFLRYSKIIKALLRIQYFEEHKCRKKINP
jgi:hypothetical protein